MIKMKAYNCMDKNGDSPYSTVVFAESRGKAIATALHTEALEDYGFTEIRAIRVKTLDKYYHGNREMDWCNSSDRVALVKEAGYTCSYEVDPLPKQCESCPANKWCSRYVDE